MLVSDPIRLACSPGTLTKPKEKLMIRTKITKLGFVRAALAVSVAISFVAGSNALAQAPSSAAASVNDTPQQMEGNPSAIGPSTYQGGATLPGGATAETERIIVTGSNIPTA